MLNTWLTNPLWALLVILSVTCVGLNSCVPCSGGRQGGSAPFWNLNLVACGCVLLATDTRVPFSAREPLECHSCEVISSGCTWGKSTYKFLNVWTWLAPLVVAVPSQSLGILVKFSWRGLCLARRKSFFCTMASYIPLSCQGRFPALAGEDSWQGKEPVDPTIKPWLTFPLTLERNWFAGRMT